MIEPMDPICGDVGSAGTPILFSGRLPIRSGTMVKGILNAEVEDCRDAWLPLLWDAPISFTYAGRISLLSGDIALGVGMGNEERDTSPGDGGGLLLASILASTGLVAVSVVFLIVVTVSSVFDRVTGVGNVLRDFWAKSELALEYSGLVRGRGDEVAELIIAMAAAVAEPCGIGEPP